MLVLRNKLFHINPVVRHVKPGTHAKFIRQGNTATKVVGRKTKKVAQDFNVLDPRVAGETVGNFVKRPVSGAAAAFSPPLTAPVVYKPVAAAEQVLLGDTVLYQQLNRTGDKVGRALENTMLEAAPYHSYLPAGPGGQIYVRTP